jgi:hypothetical protein
VVRFGSKRRDNNSFTSRPQGGGMRWVLPLLLLVAPGCAETSGAVMASGALAVPVFGRDLGDLVYSAVTGRDCSVVRLDEGKSYCKPTAPPPAPATFCTRSLGVVDCWANPDGLNGQPVQGVADGPRTLTPEQEANRTARWPHL